MIPSTASHSGQVQTFGELAAAGARSSRSAQRVMSASQWGQVAMLAVTAGIDFNLAPIARRRYDSPDDSPIVARRPTTISRLARTVPPATPNATSGPAVLASHPPRMLPTPPPIPASAA